MRRKRLTDEQFAAMWQAAASLSDVARMTKHTVMSARMRAVRLRKSGLTLKKFSARANRPESKSVAAAHVARAERLTFYAAAERFGLTQQAVRQAYVALYPGEPPPSGYGDVMIRNITAELARSGRPDGEIAEEVGLSTGQVARIRRQAGVRLQLGKPAKFAAAMELVRSGVPAAEAAAACGVSYGHLIKMCQAAGVALAGRGGRNGRAVAAANLVERGALTVAKAAALMRCTPASVHVVLRNRLIGRGR